MKINNKKKKKKEKIINFQLINQQQNICTNSIIETSLVLQEEIFINFSIAY